jgi:hypothetical protein
VDHQDHHHLTAVDHQDHQGHQVHRLLPDHLVHLQPEDK